MLNNFPIRFRQPSGFIMVWMLLGLFTTIQLQAQHITQTVKGIVIDKASEKPLAGVSVTVTGISVGATTDSTGSYKLANVPVGRQRISFTSVGYKPVSIPEVLVTIGKQVIVDVSLEESIRTLNEVSVSAPRVRKGMALNEFAGSSARSFSMDEVTRYAGGRNDPARMASNFAGVSSTNDSRNDIVVRGNSPAAVLWRMEGIPIPNPNHFTTLGTTGGPVSALNTNALKNSDFYTGAFPAEYGNASGAVFDLSLRAGNKDKVEKTLQLNLFSGLEAMIEGPLSKKKNGSSFLVGYRYSFAQIAQGIGLKFGTEAVPKYQDIIFNINFANSKLGKFGIFGLGGTSNIDFIGADLDSADLYANKDEDTYFKSRISFIGIKHTIDVGRNAYIRSVLSYSYTSNKGDVYKYYDSLPEREYLTRQETENTGLRFSTYINSKVNTRFTMRGGLLAELNGLDTYLETRESRPAWETTRDYNGSSWLLQPYVLGKYRFTEKLSLNAGVHGMYYTFNEASAVEPRASLGYALDNTKTITASYGFHSQLQPLPVYLYQEKLSNDAYDQSNRELGFTKAHHYILGYDWVFAKDWRLKAEVYYQHIFDAAVEKTASGFSVLNSGADFSFPEKAGLVNNGFGSNSGVELTIEKFFSKGYYLLTTASLFDSKYKGSDGIKRNSTFNNRSILNVLAGKEWKLGNSGRNVFSVDIKMAYSGGRYYTPVDLSASALAGSEILDETRFNEAQFPDYFRLDTRFGFRLNSSKRRFSQTLYLDLQNVTNRDNVFVYRYNQVQKQVGTVYQIGFFPDIMYKIQW